MIAAERWGELIDDYMDTIHAMVGFANFYRYDDDTGRMREEVVIMQGWRFTPVEPPGDDGELPDYVTPDLAVMHREDAGVVAEVKKSFPKDKSLWADDFRQLMSYDTDLEGWPSASERVTTHDVVLVVHHSRSTAVRDYYLEQAKAGQVSFRKPFAIV